MVQVVVSNSNNGMIMSCFCKAVRVDHGEAILDVESVTGVDDEYLSRWIGLAIVYSNSNRVKYIQTYYFNKLEIKLNEFIGLFNDNLKTDESDNINHPNHYGGENNPLEVINIIEHYELGFHLGNVVKYVLRADKKGNRNEDLKKALWYLEREIMKDTN